MTAGWYLWTDGHHMRKYDGNAWVGEPVTPAAVPVNERPVQRVEIPAPVQNGTRSLVQARLGSALRNHLGRVIAEPDSSLQETEPVAPLEVAPAATQEVAVFSARSLGRLMKELIRYGDNGEVQYCAVQGGKFRITQIFADSAYGCGLRAEFDAECLVETAFGVKTNSSVADRITNLSGSARLVLESNTGQSWDHANLIGQNTNVVFPLDLGEYQTMAWETKATPALARVVIQQRDAKRLASLIQGPQYPKIDFAVTPNKLHLRSDGKHVETFEAVTEGDSRGIQLKNVNSTHLSNSLRFICSLIGSDVRVELYIFDWGMMGQSSTITAAGVQPKRWFDLVAE